MVSTRSMRSRGAENGKQTGEIVDSYTSKKTAALPARAPAEKDHKEVRREPHNTVKESNAAAVKAADPVEDEQHARKSTRRRQPATKPEVGTVEEVEAEEVEVDDLQNAASIPLPEDDGVEVPEQKKMKSSPRKPRSQVAAQPPPRQQRSSAISWKWIVLLLALTAGTAFAVAYRHTWQPHLTESLRQVEGHLKAQARNVEAYIRGPLLLKAKAWQGILQQQAHRSRNHVAEMTLRLRYGVLNLWRRAQKMIMPEEKVEDVKGCAAQLDAGALVALVSHKPAFEGLRASLQDIWLGHKEDPHKGAGVLLVGGSESANAAAALALEKALPSSCRSCLLTFKAGQANHGHADAPGAVQKQLAGFLQRCPQGVVILEGVQNLHPRLLPVFINALSEHGHFEVGGKAVPSWGALYVATMLDSEGDVLAQPAEETFKKEAKKALTAELMAHPSADHVPGYKAHTEAFRRRLEYVAPLQH